MKKGSGHWEFDHVPMGICPMQVEPGALFLFWVNLEGMVSECEWCAMYGIPK